MRLAIISDTHFGDTSCVLVTDKNGKLVPGEKYPAFAQAIGQDLDYLVLVGDIFDFSIAPYEDAYRYGRFFFGQLQNDRIIKKTEDDRYGPLIYVAGNHDADIWHIVQHQRKVINRLINGKLPERYEHSIAGILDDRLGSPTKGFTLNKTNKRLTKDQIADANIPYGDMFLESITSPKTLFYFAYPNLYFVSDEHNVLITHGQYLESYWSLASEMAIAVAYDALGFVSPDQAEIDMEKLVELNYPLNQLACTGVGQAGALTQIVREVQKDVYNHSLKRIETYVRRFADMLDDKVNQGLMKELLSDAALVIGKRLALRAIESIGTARFNPNFSKNKDVQGRLRKFYRTSLLEINDLNTQGPMKANPIPNPRRVIFGHTHEPVTWADENTLTLDLPGLAGNLTLHNTGGWIKEGNVFHGAEIFTYETGKLLASTRVQ